MLAQHHKRWPSITSASGQYMGSGFSGVVGMKRHRHRSAARVLLLRIQQTQCWSGVGSSSRVDCRTLKNGCKMVGNAGKAPMLVKSWHNVVPTLHHNRTLPHPLPCVAYLTLTLQCWYNVGRFHTLLNNRQSCLIMLMQNFVNIM